MSSTTLGKRSREESGLVPRTPTKRRVVQLQTPEKSPSHKRGLSTSSSRSTSTSISGTTPYSPAKSVLRRSAAAGIVGREKESTAIRNFLDGEHGVLYICGPPGTGKTATVTQVTTPGVDKSTTTSSLPNRVVVTINCVSLKKPESIYEQILSELKYQGTTLSKLQDAIEDLDRKGHNLLLILDEVDYLASNKSRVMYNIFELGKTALIKVIGIANALNLTDSILPLLQRTGIEPAILRFRPYTPTEITEILSSRVSEIALPSGTSKVVDKTALIFLGKKVANATGDIRKALDILRKSIEVVESEYRSALSSLPVNAASGPRLASVGIAHISKVAGRALAGPVGSGATAMATCSLHEKAILCAIVVRKVTTAATIFTAYSSLCLRDKMLHPLSRGDFATVLSGLLDNGLLTTTTTAGSSSRSTSKRGRRRLPGQEDRIVLGVGEMDVLNGIGDIGILKRFFDV